MNRKEAEKLVGQRVSAWTAMNGVYVGVLEELVPNTSPWRGRVRITGVLECAAMYDLTRRFPRRGFRPGDTIEVGGVNIERCDKPGYTYLAALRNELAMLKGRPWGRDEWVRLGNIQNIQAAIEAEELREGDPLGSWATDGGNVAA